MTATVKKCLCGCGKTTKSTFAQGHDARLKARLRKEHGQKFIDCLARTKSVADAFILLSSPTSGLVKSKERQTAHGEVFTPAFLVEKMLNLIPDEVWNDPNKTILEPSCGNGNFVEAIIARKIRSGSSLRQALSTTFGIDILRDNIEECRRRIYQKFIAPEPKKTQSDLKNRAVLQQILKKNVICADALALDFHTLDDVPPLSPSS